MTNTYATQQITDAAFKGSWVTKLVATATPGEPRTQYTLTGEWTFVYQGISKRITTKEAQTIGELTRALRGHVPRNIEVETANLLWAQVPQP